MNPEPSDREKPRRWKKGHGTYARMKTERNLQLKQNGLWSPFDQEAVVMDEGKKLDVVSWMDEQAEKALSKKGLGPIVLESADEPYDEAKEA